MIGVNVWNVTGITCHRKGPVGPGCKLNSPAWITALANHHTSVDTSSHSVMQQATIS